MIRPLGYIGSLLSALLLADVAVFGQTQKPLLIRSQGVGQIFRMAPPVYGVLEDHASPIQLDISRTFTNYWSQDKRYRIDDEMIDDEARWSFHWAKTLRVGLGFNVRRFAYTATDQAAITVHDMFFMGQDGRLEAGKHKLIYQVPDYNLQYQAQDKNQSFSELAEWDVSLPLQWAPLQPLKMSLTLMGSYELARAGTFPQGSQDRGWQWNVSYPLEASWLFGSITQVLFDQRVDNKVALYSQQMGWTLGLGHQLDSNQQLVGQFMVYQPVFRQMGQLSKNSYEIHLAYRYLWEGYALEATVIENIFWLYNTPDWGLCLGLRLPLAG